MLEEIINQNNIIQQFIIMIIGLVIGLVIGYKLFKKYIIKGPDSNEVIKETYIDNKGQEYKLIPQIHICPIALSMDKLHDPNYYDPNH